MKKSKKLAKNLLREMGTEQLRDMVAVADYVRWIADEEEEYADSVFEIGVKEIVKEYKKLCRKEKKENVEMYSNGDHFEPLTDIEEAISLLSGAMRKAQYSERDVQHFVREFYEQFNVPEKRRLLLKQVGTVTSFCEDIGGVRWIIESDDGALYDAFSEDIRGGRDLYVNEVVSFIPDGTTAKYIENAQHCDQEEDEGRPLKYSPASIDDFWDLRDMMLYLTAPANPDGIGEGTVFIYKETPEGGTMRNFFVRHDGALYLSEFY